MRIRDCLHGWCMLLPAIPSATGNPTAINISGVSKCCSQMARKVKWWLIWSATFLEKSQFIQITKWTRFKHNRINQVFQTIKLVLYMVHSRFRKGLSKWITKFNLIVKNWLILNRERRFQDQHLLFTIMMGSLRLYKLPARAKINLLMVNTKDQFSIKEVLWAQRRKTNLVLVVWLRSRTTSQWLHSKLSSFHYFSLKTNNTRNPWPGL